MPASPQTTVDMCDSDMEQYFDFESASCDPSHQPKTFHPDVIESGMDVYFDFDAASSESGFEDSEKVCCVNTDPIETNAVFCPPSQLPLVEVTPFMDVVQLPSVPEQDLDDAMHVGTYAPNSPNLYHDTTIEVSETPCGYYKDMDPTKSSSSAPSTPSSLFLTPPSSPSPIPSSCDDESMSEYSDEDCNSNTTPSRNACQSPILDLKHGLAVSANGIAADSPAPSNQDSPLSSVFTVQTPRAESSSKINTVRELEFIAQAPADIKPVDLPESESLNSPRSIVDDDDYSPSRSPSPAEIESGPVHRVGHTPKRKKRKSALKCPKCDETFTRLPDLNRHDFNVHTHRKRMEIFRDLSDRKRRWCMGVFIFFPEDDSRRRHEDICVWFKEYSEKGVRNAMFLPVSGNICGEERWTYSVLLGVPGYIRRCG
ncbi:hypothetical protein R3P38DRAFT_3287760 [Favolaschia claudopus]|uniref:C2H2-type domain-containing protein n=1 Tax=Favolaschia claudopus TaxID=2862362 RepID=A0AAV9ZZS2_9AGAR